MDCKFVALMVAFLVGAHAKPASEINPDVETVDIGRQGPFTFFSPHFPSFGFWGFPDFQEIQRYIDNIRESIFGSIEGIDASCNGTTSSSTKVINGNVVTVNCTVYNEDGTEIVIKKVDVHPVDSKPSGGPSGNPSEESSEGPIGEFTSNPAPSKPTANTDESNDLETFEDNNQNERLSIHDNLETFDHAVFNRRHHYNVDNIQEVTANDIDSKEYNRHWPIDLSRDTLINDWAAAHGFPRNPDAEDIDVGPFGSQAFRGRNSIRQRFS